MVLLLTDNVTDKDFAVVVGCDLKISTIFSVFQTVARHRLTDIITDIPIDISTEFANRPFSSPIRKV